MADGTTNNENIDPTESFQRNDMPLWITIMFLAFIAWGVGYSAYYLLTGFDSEKIFDSKNSAAASARE